MSTLITLLAGYMTSGTWWIFPMAVQLGAGGQKVLVPATLQGFRASCLTTGRFRTAHGSSPSFDPATALYVSSDMLTNLCAVNNITIHGDVVSSRRVLKCEHNWKTFLTLDQALAHKHLGKTMPSAKIILAAYANDEDIEA